MLGVVLRLTVLGVVLRPTVIPCGGATERAPHTIIYSRKTDVPRIISVHRTRTVQRNKYGSGSKTFDSGYIWYY